MRAKPDSRKGAILRISEIYASLQGEGLLTGTPSIFVRTSGCNLRCWFCDTRHASWEPEGDYRSIDEILSDVSKCEGNHVVLTGGEPMIYHVIPKLCAALRTAGYHLTIETAGTVHHALECDLMSLSPKLSSSAPDASAGSWRDRHNQRRERLDGVRALTKAHAYQLKFVVDSHSDAMEVRRYLERLTEDGSPIDNERVLLMPQGTQQSQLDQQAAWLQPWCDKYGFQFCPRAHIQWYGNRRGT